MEISELFMILAPLIIIQIILVVTALIDLVKRPKTMGPKWLWAVLIIFVNILGPILYFLFGRKEHV